MHYLPRKVDTDQFVDFLVCSEGLCSTSLLSSGSLKLANLLLFAGGSSKNWRSKFGSSHEIPSLSPEELLDFSMLVEKTKIVHLFMF